MKSKSTNLQLRGLMLPGSVDVEAGVIRGATVAKAGVQALGHRVMLDASGAVTLDEEKSVREVPVFTDERTLDTLMAAADKGGGKFKTREDHNDAIGARAGFSEGFRRTEDGRVTADIGLFASYPHRATVLEAARQTPRDIGLSIDFLPSFEIIDGRAMMRVEKLDAVDIVDKGAITPDGMFLSAGVDTAANGQPAQATSTTSTMPETTSTPDVASALAAMTKTITDCMSAMTAAVSSMAPKPAAPPAEEMTAMKALVEKMQTQLQDITNKGALVKRERMLLGIRATPEEMVKLGSASDDELQQRLAAQKDFLTMTRETRANLKCNAATAQTIVLKTPEGKAAYRAHLDARIYGVSKPSAAPAGAN
jgi:hypothetical protein